MTEAVEVEQIDRDAAADYTVEQLGEHDYLAALLADMREGRADGSKLVQAFARHLIAARAEALEDAAKVAEATGNFGDYARDELTADYGQPRFDMMHQIITSLRALSPIKDRNNAG